MIIDYKSYKFKICLDTERKCLSGDVLIYDEMGTWFDSD